MAILNNSNAISTAGGYDINNSLRFRSSASAYLNRTPTVAGNQQKFTWSGWVKIGYFTTGYLQAADGNSGNAMTSWYMRGLGSTGVFEFEHFNGTTTYNLTTNAVFRDPSAWYHITVAVDTTQATSADRTKIYVNGNQQTVTGTYVPQNTSLYVNGTTIQAIGSRKNVSGGYGAYFDGYLTEVNFIDGQALTPSSFGETDTTTGVWKPKAYSGTYGTNGFYLKFSDIATTSGSNAGLGKDFSGNSNYWTTNNISVTSGTTYDAMKDVPTNTSATVANYATLNTLMAGTPFQTNAAATVSQGNLQADWGTTSTGSLLSTIAMTSGKWYFEGTVTGTNTREVIGIVNSSAATTTYAGGDANGWGYFSVNGNKYNNGSATSYGATYTTNDIIGVAFDADAGSLTFYKNGTSQGTAFTGLASGTYFFAVSDANASLACGWNVNFGQRPFTYTPPTGYLALNTFNLPNPTILQGNKYMDATLWTGTGSAQTITNAGGFKPDFVWGKSRSNAGTNNVLEDSVRGASVWLSSDLSDNESTLGTGPITSFNSNGFSVGTGLNGSTRTYVGWQWQSGQGSTSSNTSGSITSTVSVNTTAGFSVITWSGNSTSGATIGHGLGVAPKMFIVKNRTNAEGWVVGHTSIGWSNFLQINNTNASASSAFPWNNTAPSSTLITLGSGTGTNGSGYTYVGYAWAEIAGFSRFGSYTGNGSADGPFVFCNFRPKWIMFKRTDSSTNANWMILDTSRNTYNVADSALFANLSNAELTSYPVDILSNGFKIRGTTGETNVNGGTYIVAAFAENPFKNSLAR